MRFFLFCWLALFTACSPSVIKHNQHLAAKEGEKFAKVALVERNYNEALRLSTFPGNNESTEQLRSLVESMHPSTQYPRGVVAVAYEPIPGSESMKIYLEGSGNDPSYHYMAVLVGTELRGYKVSAISRSKEPFPGSNLIQPLR